VGSARIEARAPTRGPQRDQIVDGTADLPRRGVGGTGLAGEEDHGVDGPRAPERRVRRPARALGQRLLDGLARVFAEEAEALRADLAVGVKDLGQPDRADGDAVELGRLLTDGIGELRRAAPDVDAQRARRPGLALEDAEADEPRLLLARDHLELEAGLVA